MHRIQDKYNISKKIMRIPINELRNYYKTDSLFFIQHFLLIT
jgi:hypothetical protein